MPSEETKKKLILLCGESEMKERAKKKMKEKWRERRSEIYRKAETIGA
jgi:hypothetical protein